MLASPALNTGVMSEMKTLREIAQIVQMDKSHLRWYAKKKGFEWQKQRTPESGGRKSWSCRRMKLRN